MTTTKLTDQQRRAAAMVAGGDKNRDICESLDIGESTLLRWKRRQDFRALVADRAIVVDSGGDSNIEILQNARDDELVLMAELREALEAMVMVLGTRLKSMSEDEINELPVRLIPTFLNSFTEGFSNLQGAHDRLSGYGLILRELGAILESDDTTAKID